AQRPEEERGTALGAGLDRGGVELVGPAVAAQAHDVEQGGGQEQAEQRGPGPGRIACPATQQPGHTSLRADRAGVCRGWAGLKGAGLSVHRASPPGQTATRTEAASPVSAPRGALPPRPREWSRPPRKTHCRYSPNRTTVAARLAATSTVTSAARPAVPAAACSATSAPEVSPSPMPNAITPRTWCRAACL